MSLRPIICTALLATLLGACKTAQFSGSTSAKGSGEPTPQGPDATTPAGSPSATPSPGTNPDGSPASTPATSPAAGSPAATTPATGSTAPSGTAGSGTPASTGSTPNGTGTTANNGNGTSGTGSTANNGTGTTANNGSGTTGTGSTANNGTGTSGTGGNASTPPTSTPNGPTCTPGHTAVGARVAFLIDNSGSNSYTDCPSRVAAGQSQGVNIYTCSTQTNREVAVLSAYDILAKFAADNTADALSQSQISISSFPTAADQYNGYAKQQAWIQIDGQTRTTVANAMLFARSPVGATPYGAAMTAATEMFQTLPGDTRRNVAILVSDGQPTDANPASVLAQAAALKAKGVSVIVLDYNGSPASSYTVDKKQMSDYEASMQKTNQHWFTANYASFDDYIKALLGDASGAGSLAFNMTSTGTITSVQNSAALTAALNSLVSTSTVGCTP